MRLWETEVLTRSGTWVAFRLGYEDDDIGRRVVGSLLDMNIYV